MRIASPNNSPSHDPCRLCGSQATLVATQQVLSRYDVAYYQCPMCDLIQTQRPFWLQEAYASALSDFDTGAVARDRLCTELTLALAWLVGVHAESSCLDFGGGHGVLTRALRDQGYNFHWHDKYAQNLFARGFEGTPEEPRKLVTCFEVLEHLPDAGADLRSIFGPGHDALLVATFLHNGHRENWWYYCPEAGQHVAFYSARTMDFIAQKFGYEAIVGRRYTLFVRPGALVRWKRLLAAAILRRAKPDRQSRATWISLALRPRHKSRTWNDHVEMMSRQAMRLKQAG